MCGDSCGRCPATDHGTRGNCGKRARDAVAEAPARSQPVRLETLLSRRAAPESEAPQAAVPGQP